MKRMEWLDHMLQYRNPEQLLDDLVQAMSDAEAIENFEFICRMWDIPELGEEEEEEED